MLTGPAAVMQPLSHGQGMQFMHDAQRLWLKASKPWLPRAVLILI